MTIYFAQIGHDGPIKVGDSKDVPRRLRALQVGVPWVLRLLLVLENASASEIYHDFSAARMRGEWFYPTHGLLQFIESQHKLSDRNGASWVKARRRAGTNLTFMRRVADICDLPPSDQERAAS